MDDFLKKMLNKDTDFKLIASARLPNMASRGLEVTGVRKLSAFVGVNFKFKHRNGKISLHNNGLL